MRIISKQMLASLAFCLLIVLLFGSSCRAQVSGQEQRNATSFIDSMAKPVYNFAWPTATYRESSLDGFESVNGGFNVLVKLSGQSAFDNSDLWVKLAFMFRYGKFYDIRVRDHNAFLVAPFATTRTLVGVAAGLAKTYDDQQKAQAARDANASPPAYVPPATSSYAPPRTDSSVGYAASTGLAASSEDSSSLEGTCLHNPTDHDISFEYRLDQGPWKQDKLESNMNLSLTWKDQAAKTGSRITIRYEDDSEGPNFIRTYGLEGTSTEQPASCEQLKSYHFEVDGTKTIVYTGAS